MLYTRQDEAMEMKQGASYIKLTLHNKRQISNLDQGGNLPTSSGRTRFLCADVAVIDIDVICATIYCSNLIIRYTHAHVHFRRTALTRLAPPYRSSDGRVGWGKKEGLSIVLMGERRATKKY